ncbi:MAG: hypothetical protein CL561_10140 [Alphaproteobacteria bacterium]|jgi:hypothetical protein|nr:hypothetical protein [Alphaproteobacteria bacterium]|tara:strand:+ start:1377 stop:2072 length:696 start_codon:yes stop_codon:yes gene_type:complete
MTRQGDINMNNKKQAISFRTIKCALCLGVTVFALSGNIAGAQSLYQGESFLDERQFRAQTQQLIQDEQVVLPNLLELRKDQEEATTEFRLMLDNIIADLDSDENFTYEKPVMKSLFFNLQEYALIQEARRGFEARLPGSGVSTNAAPTREIRARRDLILGGIVYKDKKQWTIYLNELRITPENLPDEILDIQVSNDFVRLKWFDKGTNTIFPVKLRPNQTFNLDAKLFFPG